VVCGFDTLVPAKSLLRAKNDPNTLKKILPDLEGGDEPKINEMSYVPDVYNATVDWGQIFSPGRKNEALETATGRDHGKAVRNCLRAAWKSL